MSAVNQKKDAVQQHARTLWRSAGEWGLLAMATGSGKTKCAIDEHIRLDTELFGRVRTLLVVPTEKLRDDNWREEYDKWGAHAIYSQVTRKCYASVNRLEMQYYDLVILDEAHNLTENNASFFEKNSVKRVLALTATPPDPKGSENDKKKCLLFKQLRLKTDMYYPLEQALKDGLVSNLEIWVVETKLNDTDKTVVAGSKAAPFMQTEKDRYEFLGKQMKKFYGNPKMFQWKTLERMRVVYDSIEKTTVAERLIKRVSSSENRTLVFCGGIDQAEKLVPGSTYHSKTTGEGLKRFMNKETNILGVVQALNEGMNVPDIDIGIIVQLTSNSRDLVQRVGRCIRLREGHTARIFILVAYGTQDEKWFESAITEFPAEVIKYVHAKNI